jgi:hypothetical protein
MLEPHGGRAADDDVNAWERHHGLVAGWRELCK